MAATPLNTSRQCSSRWRSLEAYVLPHVLEVSAGAHGVVTSVRVAPHEVVRRGQAVATLQPLVLTPGCTDLAPLVVKAPVDGLITSSRAATGDVVAGSCPIVSMSSAEDVLVVARFPPESATCLHQDDAATVRLGATAQALPARIVSVIVAPEWDAVAAAPAGRSARVVLSVADAPVVALWPGTPADVQIG